MIEAQRTDREVLARRSAAGVARGVDRSASPSIRWRGIAFELFSDHLQLQPGVSKSCFARTVSQLRNSVGECPGLTEKVLDLTSS